MSRCCESKTEAWLENHERSLAFPEEPAGRHQEQSTEESGSCIICICAACLAIRWVF